MFKRSVSFSGLVAAVVDERLYGIELVHAINFHCTVVRQHKTNPLRAPNLPHAAMHNRVVLSMNQSINHQNH